MTKILITGASGMIGFHLLKSLSSIKNLSLYAVDKNIYSFDCLTYNKERINELTSLNPNIKFFEMDLTDSKSMHKILDICPDVIIHLAASAGIAESFKNPQFILNNNHISFLNILELIRVHNLDTKLLYASSSSVYGKTLDSAVETSTTLFPTSSYGLSKLMNEQLAQLYYQNYGIVSIGLRFFTVYGEYNRKDMLMHYLLDSFYKNKQVTLYNNGLMQRDFTYVEDVVQSIIAMIESYQFYKHELFNIGGTGSSTLNEVVNIMQNYFANKPHIIKEPFIPPYDPLKTYCNNEKLLSYYPFLKFTSLENGIHNLVNWYKKFYKDLI